MSDLARSCTANVLAEKVCCVTGAGSFRIWGLRHCSAHSAGSAERITSRTSPHQALSMMCQNASFEEFLHRSVK